MPRVERVGDVNTAGGVAQVGVSTVIVNGRPIIVNGNPVTPHPPCPIVPIHCSAVTANGLSTVVARSIPVVRRGDIDTCGHPRQSASPNVIAG